MFNQYGSVLCVSCESSMRLSTVEPGEDGICRATFECRYPPCARSRVMVIGKLQLGQDVLSVVGLASVDPDERPRPKRRRLGLPLSGRRRDKALTRCLLAAVPAEQKAGR
jgi:hypothetical protein